MKKVAEIIDTFGRYDGIMRAKDLSRENITYYEIMDMIQNKYIKKIKYGLYGLSSFDTESDLYLISSTFPELIISDMSALSYYNYIERTPHDYHFSIVNTASRTKYSIEGYNIKIHYVDKKRINIGLIKQMVDGKEIQIYDRERVICDCLRHMDTMDKEIFNSAIRNYLADDEKDLVNLTEYSKKLGVYNKVKRVIDIWL